MNAELLDTFERLAHSAMVATGQDALKAQEALQPFETQPALTAQLKFVLDNSTSSIAQTYSAVCLVKLVQNHWNSYSVQTRVDIRNYVLNLLAERGPQLARDLRLQLLTLLAKITKLGWFDGEELGPDSPGNVHQRTVDQVTSFFRPDSPHHSLIGLEILIRLLEEVGAQAPTVSLTEHRRISIGFRDSVLLKVFKLSLTTLRAVDSGNISDAEKPFASLITTNGLRLAMLCLSYDFVGTSPSESTEDHNVLKIPNQWKALFDEGDGVALLDLFWNLFNKSTSENRCMAMEIIVDLSSVRRSLFSDDDQRNRHLASLMNGITDVLLAWQDNKALLEDSDTLHQFCRLLARLKGNFQLSQIVNAEGYSDWIRLVGQFSLLQDWSEHANSHHYVMQLWARLVAAIPYLDSTRSRAATTGMLEQYAPKVLETFVNTRLAAVQQRVFEDPTDDPLPEEDAAELSDLEALPALGRIKYLRTAQALEQQLAAPSNAYQQLRLQAQHSPDLAVAEGQLALLVLVIAGIVGGRSGTSATNTDAHNEIDAALTARVLKIMQAHDQALDRNAGQELAASTKRLELSLLAFLQEFRKVYIGDVSLGTTRMFEKLQELLNIGDSNTMLGLMMRKIVLDLRYWAGEVEVVDAATQLFHELVCGYATIRLVVKLDTTNAILESHASETLFPFLQYANNQRCRVLFYTTLSKLLYMKSDGGGAGDSTDADATPERLFAAFVAPFTARLDLLLQQSEAAALRSDTARDMLVGLLLDLRGFVFGIYSRKAYERFFEWIYPTYLSVFHTAAAVWADTPAVLIHLLKFWHELANNRSTRIQFDVSSANGILLFKETSRFVVAVASGVRQIAVPSELDLWAHKYKPITHLLNVLCAALQGNYCNFGVFKLYDDPALTDAISVGFDAALSLPIDDILHYTKLTLVYFQTIDRVLAHHIEYACMLPRAQFTKLLLTLEQGITFSEASVSTQCCNALDALATYVDKYRQAAPERAPEPWHQLVAHVQALRAEFTQTFRTLLHYALFDNCPNQWSCSRPLFSLTLILPDALTSYSSALIAKQTEGNRAKLEQLFLGLLNDCGQHLAFKNREQFTQNFSNFRTEVSKFVTTEQVI